MRAIYVLLIAGIFLFQEAAYAVIISGEVTSVDSGTNQVTVRRSDTNELVKVRVRDASQLSGLQTGNQINMSATERIGGGTLYDIGVYCINAARYLFRSEPVEVMATTAGRAGGVEEMTGAMLKFPGERLAVFVCSFGASDVSYYRVTGTKGDLRSEAAYEYSEPLHHYLTIDGNTVTKNFPKRDQFAPEIAYFSDCILHDRRPEPSGVEGLIDVQIVEALYRSARTRRPVPLKLSRHDRYPTSKQERRYPPSGKPPMVKTRSPHS